MPIWCDTFSTFSTWWDKQDAEELAWRKLDRVMCNPACLSSILLLARHFAKPNILDHSRIKATIREQKQRKSNSFKFLNVWTEHPLFIQVLQDSGCFTLKNMLCIKWPPHKAMRKGSKRFTKNTLVISRKNKGHLNSNVRQNYNQPSELIVL